MSTSAVFPGGASSSSGFSYPSVVTWDAGKLGTGLALDGTALTVSKTSSSGAHAMTMGIVSSARIDGLWYLELLLASGGAAPAMMGGLASLNDPLTGYVGSSPNGYSIYAQSGDKYNNSGNSGFLATLSSPSDRLMIAYAPVYGRLWFGKNGTWGGGGDPSNFIAPAFTGVPPGLVPGASMYNSGSSWTLCAKAASQIYTPPTRFKPWDAT